MKPAFLAPAGTLEKKPRHGQPCNRCGLCCVATLCPLGRALFKQDLGPCPALSYDDHGSVCGLIADPARYITGTPGGVRALMLHGAEKLGDAAAILNGSGTGCDARMNGEPADLDFYGRLRRWDHDHRKQISEAKKTWGLG